MGKHNGPQDESEQNPQALADSFDQQYAESQGRSVPQDADARIDALKQVNSHLMKRG